MKIISWNVNGINSSIKHGLFKFIGDEMADIYCFQEIKVSQATIDKNFIPFYEKAGFSCFWNEADKKGYSGVMTLSKVKPMSVSYGIDCDEFDHEGRVVTVEFADFYLVNAYVPNAGRGLPRLPFKLEYNEKFSEFLNHLRKTKPVVACGDLNVCHKEIDIARPKSNKKSAGFTIEERNSFSALLDSGFVDTFRVFNQDPDQYTWWSYRNQARSKNIGWRLDYFIVSKKFLPHILKSEILAEVLGSDHCPIMLKNV
ncbi:MAG: exodeoxyribonuclease III [Promethearchaeota archaeon]